MSSDFHEVFDDATQDKLRLYRSYLDEWVPVFAQRPPPSGIVNVFDFFCGVGKDSKGVRGSALLALDAVKVHWETFREKKTNVRLTYFDQSGSAIERLRNSLEHEEIPEGLDLCLEVLEFEKAFPRSLKLMRNAANMVFLDQFGIKYATRDVLVALAQMDRTDLLFFESSSIVSRMHNQPEIRKYIALDAGELAETSHEHIHRLVCKHIQGKIPRDLEYYLSPFSIKRSGSANINGLIFGSGNLLGLDKFLTCCWNNFEGDANYDIDSTQGLQMDLFQKKVPRIEEFQTELYEKIKIGSLGTELDVWRFTLLSGYLGRHARPIIQKLKEDGVLMRKPYRISKSCRNQPRRLELL